MQHTARVTDNQITHLSQELANHDRLPEGKIWISPESIGGRTIKPTSGRVRVSIMRGAERFDVWHGYEPHHVISVEFVSSGDTPESITAVRGRDGRWKVTYTGEGFGAGYLALFEQAQEAARHEPKPRPERLTRRIGG